MVTTRVAADAPPVPLLWPGETVVLIGTGPSLTQADVDFCRGRARVVAIKDAYQVAPWADALYCADEVWWMHHGRSLEFEGLRFALVAPERRYIEAVRDARAQRLQIGGSSGLDGRPTHLRTGAHSGFSAINLAAHLGARRIVLLGYDLQASPDGAGHFFGEHAYRSTDPGRRKSTCYDKVDVYQSLVEPLAARGISVVNATRQTALTVFPQLSIQEALA